ncbi:PREDICTED: vitellogenin-1-like [Bactrocera latifrons]|uniref:vitellogenin-1-like n=1 Tax=Bactrocera latifrons TaxID=174628 RepID=UPI0008DD4EA0|nr:PREDICTED: vitellogenin-1-like [Bactrocera latifrons]
MKIVQLLLAVIVIKQCFGVEIPLDQDHGLEVSFLDIFRSVRDIASGLVQSQGNQLTADYFFRYTTNAVLAFPSLVTVAVVSALCAAVLREDAVQPRPENIPDVEDIAIQLRTPCNIRAYPVRELIRIVDDPDFDINKKVVIASSGWLTNANRSNDVLQGIGKAYHCRNDTNFLGIDVGRYIQTLYTWSSLNTNRIGEILAIALVDFVKVVPLENIHLMGHSLGAQIVGTTARHFTRLTGKQIPRVTGFDPAGPCFDYGQKQTTLSASDAAFVDIIHSNTGVAGQSEPTAHADFFVNGRFPIQNGCNDSVCSHQRSWQYYMESVYPGNEYNFLAKRCTSLLRLDKGSCVGDEYPMGFATPLGLQGLFVLKVNPTEPYGMNATENYTSPNSLCGTCVHAVQSFKHHLLDKLCGSSRNISSLS